MSRHSRQYYNRSTGKSYVIPYKRARKHPRKAKYFSKGFRAYNKYFVARYGISLGSLMADHFYESSNRTGFMRKFLALQPGYVEPRKSAKDLVYAALQKVYQAQRAKKHAAYSAEQKDYRRNAVYVIPDNWVTWDEENGIKEKVSNTEMSDLIRKAFIGENL